MHQGNRTLILAFDGTSNEFDDTNTNVVKLCAVLRMDDRDQQMVYYQPGIGTWTAPDIRGRVERWIAETADLACAWYLNAHILGGYEFLMDNHLPGDKICIVGFSRGAYTARALAGMIHCVGLLPKGNHEQVPFAYRMYKNNSKLAPNFKKTFCKSINIDFLGVWDTVASVGLLIPQKLPFVSNDTIKTFRHAVSLDEHRTKFNVTLWKPEQEVTDPECAADDGPKSCVEEMWFSGAHGDVGGGDVEDGPTPNLSNVPFRWMLHEIYKAKCGVRFDESGLDNLRVPYDCVPRESLEATSMIRSRLSSDATAVGDDIPTKTKADDALILPWKMADRRDAGAESHDALKMNIFWWLLQVPCWTGKRIDWTGTRLFPKDAKRVDCSQIHWTVLERTKTVKGYTPRARLPTNWQALVANEIDD